MPTQIITLMQGAPLCALSLTQPWASLVAFNQKQWETRGWRTERRGWIAIHAAKGFPLDCRDLLKDPWFSKALALRGIHEPDALPTGAIIALAKLSECIPTQVIRDSLSAKERAFGNYNNGRFAFHLVDAICLREPIPCKGALGFWKIPADVQSAICAAIPD